MKLLFVMLMTLMFMTNKSTKYDEDLDGTHGESNRINSFWSSTCLELKTNSNYFYVLLFKYPESEQLLKHIVLAKFYNTYHHQNLVKNPK